MASVMSEIKSFFSRIRFGKLVCVLLTLAVISCVTACKNETTEDSSMSVTPSTSGCLTCPLFELMYDAGDSLCQTMHAKTAGPAIKLLGAAFAIWLAFYVMKFVGSMKHPDIGGFWNGLAVRGFWLVLIAALLSNTDEILKTVVEPIFGAFLEVGMKVLAGLPAGSEGTISCSASDPKEGLLCVVAASSKRFWQAVLTACQMISFTYIFLNIMLVISGCIAIVFTFLLVILTPLYLLETIFCYFIVLSLLPMWLVAFTFPATRKFTKSAWDYLMAVFVQIFGVCIFLGLAAQIFSILMKKSFPNPATYIKNILTQGPLEALTAPAILIFVSYFIYLFSEVVLKVLNAVYTSGVPSGGAVSRMAKAPISKLAGAAKGAAQGFENDTFGSSREDIGNKNVGMSRKEREGAFGKKSRTGKADYGSKAYADSKEGKSAVGMALSQLQENQQQPENKPEGDQGGDNNGGDDKGGGDSKPENGNTPPAE